MSKDSKEKFVDAKLSKGDRKTAVCTNEIEPKLRSKVLQGKGRNKIIKIVKGATHDVTGQRGVALCGNGYIRQW